METNTPKTQLSHSTPNVIPEKKKKEFLYLSTFVPFLMMFTMHKFKVFLIASEMFD